MGDFSQAIAYHTQHLEIDKEVGDRAGEGKVYGNLGITHDSMGKAYRNLGNAHDSKRGFSQAIAYHTQCLKIAREVSGHRAEPLTGLLRRAPKGRPQANRHPPSPSHLG